MKYFLSLSTAYPEYINVDLLAIKKPTNYDVRILCTFWLRTHLLFCYVVEVLHKVWIPGKTGIPKDRVFTIKEKSEVFVAYFDEVQEQLEALACMDDLLSGTYIIIL